MKDLSTVSGHIPEIQRKGIQVMLLNIHEAPARDLLSRFGFEFSPSYLIFDGQGNEIFRSNLLPNIEKIIDLAT